VFKQRVFSNPNRALGISLGLGVALLCAFFAALLGSATAGEVAAALGSFIGGLIGAGGAVFAVYLAWTEQTRQEASKVSAAVRTEIVSLVKYVIGALEICQNIATGKTVVPAQQAQFVLQKLWANPIVYPAVADRVGLLPHPHSTTEFYMRLGEAKAIVQAIQLKANGDAMLNRVLAAQLHITADNAAAIADSLITALQLARSILADSPDVLLGDLVEQNTVQQIDDSMRWARKAFPNTETFKPG
jgi:hypothetical protein